MDGCVRCYVVAQGGIKVVDVSCEEFGVNPWLFKSLSLARTFTNQKPRVPPRAADWEVVG